MEFIEEIKIHKNKETQTFQCRVISRGRDFLVLYYKAASAGKISDIILEPGSCTIAHYRAGRGYVLWNMFHPDGTAAGSLFHICRDITITRERVSYIDLVIDIWVTPEGAPRILDEDELRDCIRSGSVSHDELMWIEEQKKSILTQYKSILAEAATSEANIDAMTGSTHT
jgi:protein associated with RNAse G/E